MSAQLWTWTRQLRSRIFQNYFFGPGVNLHISGLLALEVMFLVMSFVIWLLFAGNLITFYQSTRRFTWTRRDVLNAIRSGLGPQLVLVTTSWVFGYIGPSARSHLLHFATATVRFLQILVFTVWLLCLQDLWMLAIAAFGVLVFLCLASSMHLYASYLRYVAFFDRAMGADIDPTLHPRTGIKMLSYSPEDRRMHQVANYRLFARRAYCDSGNNSAQWHQPIATLDIQHNSYLQMLEPSKLQKILSRLFTNRRALQEHFERVAEQQLELNRHVNSHEQEHESLFTQCNCCLETETIIKSRAVYRKARVRFAFDTSSVAIDSLCSKCSDICYYSSLLEFQIGPSWRGLWKYILAAFRSTPLHAENYHHSASAADLQASARSCHLCSMIWHRLSPEQKNELLSERRVLHGSSMQESQDVLSVEQPLGVYIKVVAEPDHAIWPRQRRSNASRSLQLVPHFKGRRLPRRWMQVKLVDRARALGEDPATLWGSEHLSPIRTYVLRMSQGSRTVKQAARADQKSGEYERPLPLAMGGSTDSDEAIRFIKEWLQRHMHKSQAQCDELRLSAQLLQPEPIASSSKSPDPTTNSLDRPRRLIDLSTLEGSVAGEGYVRIVRSTQITSQDPRYVALSYCWGTKESCMLTREKEKTYSEHLSVQLLPKTILDAVNVARRLGMRYIWIDALCIIQDSDEDKTHEIMGMHHIFTNAAFVIAAAAATSSAQGFIREQNPLIVAPCLLKVRNPWSSYVSLGASETTAIYAFPGVHPKTLYGRRRPEELRLSRLLSRGWVFQEEDLARNIVYFCDSQVHVQCNVCGSRDNQTRLPSSALRLKGWKLPEMLTPDMLWYICCLLLEDLKAMLSALRHLPLKIRGPTLGPPFRMHSRDSSDVSPPLEEDAWSLQLLDEDPEEMQGCLWWDLINKYTRRILSDADDRLPAIQGLAAAIQGAIRGRDGNVSHIFGLWYPEHFVLGLLWYVENLASQRPMRHPQVPSWSWMAVEGVIAHDSHDADQGPEATGLTLLNHPTDKSQYLDVEGTIKPAVWHRLPQNERLYYIGHYRDENKVIRQHKHLARFNPVTSDPAQGPEVLILRDVERRHVVGYLILDSTDELDSNIDSVAPSINLEGDILEDMPQIHCLRITVQPPESWKRDFETPWAIRGLALIPVEGEQGIYRRIGYFELLRSESGLTFPHAFQDLHNEFYRRAQRFPPPNIDTAGFFEGLAPSTIRIV